MLAHTRGVALPTSKELRGRIARSAILGALEAEEFAAAWARSAAVTATLLTNVRDPSARQRLIEDLLENLDMVTHLRTFNYSAVKELQAKKDTSGLELAFEGLRAAGLIAES